MKRSATQDHPAKRRLASFESVLISQDGQVYANGKLLKERLDRKEREFRLVVNGKRTNFKLDRAVLQAWKPIENSDQYKVKHLDGDPANCSLENLEWVKADSYIDNTRGKFSVTAITKDQEQEFASSTEAAKFFKTTGSTIQRYINDEKPFVFQGQYWQLSRSTVLSHKKTTDHGSDFVDIPGWEYQVSPRGIVRNKNSHVVLNPIPKQSHLLIQVRGQKTEHLCKLVAQAFLNWNGETVEHIDGDFTNNRLENLRLVDQLQPVFSHKYAEIKEDLDYLPRPVWFEFEINGELFLKIPELGYIGDLGTVLNRDRSKKSVDQRGRVVFSVNGNSKSIKVKRMALALFKPIRDPENYNVIGGPSVDQLQWISKEDYNIQVGDSQRKPVVAWTLDDQIYFESCDKAAEFFQVSPGTVKERARNTVQYLVKDAVWRVLYVENPNQKPIKDDREFQPLADWPGYLIHQDGTVKSDQVVLPHWDNGICYRLVRDGVSRSVSLLDLFQTFDQDQLSTTFKNLLDLQTQVVEKEKSRKLAARQLDPAYVAKQREKHKVRLLDPVYVEEQLRKAEERRLARQYQPKPKDQSKKRKPTYLPEPTRLRMFDLSNELFAPFDCYWISPSGDVRKDTGYKMSQIVTVVGYHSVCLSLSNGTRRHFPLHRLVMMAWKPIESPELFQVDHIDDNPVHNHLDNLQWLSPSANVKKAQLSARKRLVATNQEESIFFETMGKAAQYFGRAQVGDLLKKSFCYQGKIWTLRRVDERSKAEPLYDERNCFFSIPDCPRHEISRDGVVRHKETHRMLRQVSLYGYMYVSVFFKGRYRLVRTHKLMALAFLGPPLPGQTVINHKDGNKANNNIENLEWCTPSENNKHSIYELKKLAKCAQVDSVGNVIKVWNSQIEAAVHYGIDPTSINHVLKGKQSHTRGLVFKYLE